MIEVRQTEIFEQWFEGVRDHLARKHIGRRIARLQIGLFGDCKFLGDKLFEVRIDHGPGYRLYFVHEGDTVVILLCGGIKRTQDSDIAKAKEMTAQME